MLKNIIIYGCLLFTLSACENESSQEPKSAKKSFPKVDNSTITFVTLNSPDTYFINSDNEYTGLEHDLAIAFEKYLDDERDIRIIIADSVEDVIAIVMNNQAHIAAADLTVTKERKSIINFAKPYKDVQQQVVYNRKRISKPAKKISEITDKEIVVPAATSFAERLKKYQKELQPLPNRPPLFVR